MARIFTKQSDPAEEARKGKIFAYFLGATWAAGALITLQNFYVSLTLQGEIAQRYSSYNIPNVGFLIFLGALWLVHRWYPRVIRHIFILAMALAMIFLFALGELDRLFVSLVLPIIMAAFLIMPVYSFVYYALIAGMYTLRLYLAGYTVVSDEFAFVGLGSLLVIAIVSWLIAQSLDKALAETHALNRELDQRVQDRTRELAAALERERTTAVRNKTILESIADGVLVFDAHQRVLIANPAANQLAKLNLEALTTTGVLATIEEKAREIIHSWMDGQKPDDLNNVKFIWNDRTISANIAPVLPPSTHSEQVGAGHVMVLRDFTKEAELEQAKDLFLGAVSHELRTPMSAIKGYTELLLAIEQDNVSAEGYDYLQIIMQNIKQLLTLANELIDVSRMEIGQMELYYQWVDITQVIEQAAKTVQHEFNVRNLNLTMSLDADLPKLYVDRNRIMQVLLNLLSNAYKYTDVGGATVEVSQNDQWVNITVIDTGVGIKESDKANMFTRFFRAADPFVQQAGGTGLGLNITKGLVELHGGTLTFESEYGSGTIFRVILPKNRVDSESTGAFEGDLVLQDDL